MLMKGFIEGESRSQATLFPERLDDYISEDSAVRVIDVFIDDLDISGLGFRTEANDTGAPAYHPATMLKIYVYGYLNRVQSSRRLEREAGRNVELMWLTGRLAPDHKTKRWSPRLGQPGSRGKVESAGHRDTARFFGHSLALTSELAPGGVVHALSTARVL
jgi:hypothetical protein